MKGNLLVPISIVVASLIVAGAVMFTNRGNVPENPIAQNNEEQQADPSAIRDVDDADYVKGDRSASIKIVEFSDTECPFCARLHETLDQVVAQYPQVAWAYRHFPLLQLHRKAGIEAHATECAGELGGNEAFWKYIDRVYEITPSNDGLDLDLLPEIAEFAGLNRDEFQTCMDENRHQERIEEDFNDAVVAGGRGTPFNVILLDNPMDDAKNSAIESIASQFNSPQQTIINIAEDKSAFSVSGALPIEAWQAIIDVLI